MWQKLSTAHATWSGWLHRPAGDEAGDEDSQVGSFSSFRSIRVPCQLNPWELGLVSRKGPHGPSVRCLEGSALWVSQGLRGNFFICINRAGVSQLSQDPNKRIFKKLSTLCKVFLETL